MFNYPQSFISRASCDNTRSYENLKIADLITDNNLLVKARKFALNILNDDPELKDLNNIKIRNTYKSIIKNKNIWNYIG